MRHKFDPKEIPAGQASVEETCTRCGHKRRRYKNQVTYPWGNRPCEEKEAEEPAPVPVPKVSLPVPAPVPEKPWQDHVRLRTEPRLTDAEARLKECLVILRVLYDESTAFPMTKGRLMAGRFLYSQGYQDLRHALEKAD